MALPVISCLIKRIITHRTTPNDNLRPFLQCSVCNDGRTSSLEEVIQEVRERESRLEQIQFRSRRVKGELLDSCSVPECVLTREL